jgi:hypothetical protein
MIHVIRLIFTVVFGLLWWWVYRLAGVDWLVILASVLAVCVCCCRGGTEEHQEWSFDRYQACIRRCIVPTIVLMIGIFIIGIVAVLIATGALPAGGALLNILIAAIFAPLFVRLICCAYDA